MTSVATATLGGLLALAGLTACGSADLGGRGESAPSASASTSTSAPSSTSTSPTPPTSIGPPDDLIVPPSPGTKRSTIRVSGTVSEGVEPGCRLLKGRGALYLLILRQGTLSTGQKVEVEGTVQPTLATTCQQGTPLVVEHILRP